MDKSISEHLILSGGLWWLAAVTEPLYFPLYHFPKPSTGSVFFYLLVQGKSLEDEVGYKDYEKINGQSIARSLIHSHVKERFISRIRRELMASTAVIQVGYGVVYCRN